MNFTVVASRKLQNFETAGLARWVLEWLRSLGTQRKGVERQMKLLETLPMGGKRQLMLVSCGDRQYLVGGGMESITAIVSIPRAGDVDGLQDESVCL